MAVPAAPPRRAAVGVRARTRTVRARRLEEARRGDPDDDTAGQHRPRLAAGEVLDVAEDLVPVRAGQIAADLLGLLGGAVGRLRGTVLALLTQLVARAAQRVGEGGDLLAGLRRGRVDLLLCPALGLLRRAGGLLLRGVGGLAELVGGLFGGHIHGVPPS